MQENSTKSSTILVFRQEVERQLRVQIRQAVEVALAGISDLPARDGPFLHPKAAQRTKLLFVTASSRFRGRQLSPW